MSDQQVEQLSAEDIEEFAKELRRGTCGFGADTKGPCTAHCALPINRAMVKASGIISDLQSQLTAERERGYKSDSEAQLAVGALDDLIWELSNLGVTDDDRLDAQLQRAIDKASKLLQQESLETLLMENKAHTNRVETLEAVAQMTKPFTLDSYDDETLERMVKAGNGTKAVVNAYLAPCDILNLRVELAELEITK